MSEEQSNQELSDEEAILKIAQAMKGNAPSEEEKQNVHSFLVNVVKETDINSITRIGNLRDDKDINELGVPIWNVRGALDMVRISKLLMRNKFFQEYFENAAIDTLTSSLSREGFIIKMATTQTKQVADATKRRKVNKGMFGQRKIEESGGDITSNQS